MLKSLAVFFGRTDGTPKDLMEVDRQHGLRRLRFREPISLVQRATVLESSMRIGRDDRSSPCMTQKIEARYVIREHVVEPASIGFGR